MDLSLGGSDGTADAALRVRDAAVLISVSGNGRANVRCASSPPPRPTRAPALDSRGRGAGWGAAPLWRRVLVLQLDFQDRMREVDPRSRRKRGSTVAPGAAGHVRSALVDHAQLPIKRYANLYTRRSEGGRGRAAGGECAALGGLLGVGSGDGAAPRWTPWSGMRCARTAFAGRAPAAAPAPARAPRAAAGTASSSAGDTRRKAAAAPAA